MAKNVTTIQFDTKRAQDVEVIRLINKVARIEHRLPHNLARHVLLVALQRSLDQHDATRNPEPLKAAV